MVDDPKMLAPRSDHDPVTREEFRSAMSSIDARFGAIDARFGAMDERFDAMDERFDAMDERFDAMDERFGDMRTHSGVLHEDLARKIDLLVEGFMSFSDRFPDHERRISAIETEIQFLKISRK